MTNLTWIHSRYCMLACILIGASLRSNDVIAKQSKVGWNLNMEVMNKPMSLFNINCLHFNFKLLYNVNNMFSRGTITEYLPLDDRKALVHYFTLCLVGIRWLNMPCRWLNMPGHSCHLRANSIFWYIIPKARDIHVHVYSICISSFSIIFDFW